MTSSGVPPLPGTRQMPSVLPNRIVSSADQLAPSGLAICASATGAPPLSPTRFNWPPAQNAIHWPSGEKNGSRPEPASVPSIAVAVELIQAPQVQPAVCHVYTTCEPSGDRATIWRPVLE